MCEIQGPGEAIEAKLAERIFAYVLCLEDPINWQADPIRGMYATWEEAKAAAPAGQWKEDYLYSEGEEGVDRELFVVYAMVEDDTVPWTDQRRWVIYLP